MEHGYVSLILLVLSEAMEGTVDSEPCRGARGQAHGAMEVQAHRPCHIALHCFMLILCCCVCIMLIAYMLDIQR